MKTIFSLPRRTLCVALFFAVAFVAALVTNGLPSLGEGVAGALLLGVVSRATMLDVVRLTGNDRTVGLVEELADAHPDVMTLPMRTIGGTSYPTVLRTGRPTAGFRGPNEGVTPSKSTFEKRMVECYILSGRVEVDIAIAEAFPDGQAAYEAIETVGVGSAAMEQVGKAIFYGQNATFGVGVKGFPGLIDFVDAGYLIDATGTTAATGSSVYLVRAGLGEVSLVGGLNKAIDLRPFRDGDIWVYDSVSGQNKVIPGRVADLMGWIGLQNVSKHNVARIKNLTEDSGKGLTDSLISKALQAFPIGKQPTHIFMSRRSRGQLQRSRTVTIFSGTGGKPGPGVENIAPIPTEAFGIPIVCTDSLSDVETIDLAGATPL